MKVLMLLSYPGLTGPAELALSDGEGLRKRGHSVLFGCDTRRDLGDIEKSRTADGRQDFGQSRNGDDPLAHQDFAAAIDRAGFERMRELTLCKSHPTLAEMVRDIAALRRRMADADVVHTRFSHELLLAASARKLLPGSRRPALVHSLEKPLSRRPRFPLTQADALIVPSALAREELLRQSAGRIAPEKIHVLPGRVEPQSFTPEGASLRDELGLTGKGPVFGIVSRIKIERRHALLLRAFARAADKLPDARLCVVGRGEYRPQTEALAQELGLENRVIFAGYRTGPELAQAYRTFDAKVWLVQGNDGTSRAVLEALACGTPVIAGSGGAQAEVVRSGEDGLVVPLNPLWQPGMDDREDEIAALSHALLTMSDASLRCSMAEHARQRALDFSPDRRTERLTDIYQAARAASETARPSTTEDSKT